MEPKFSNTNFFLGLHFLIGHFVISLTSREKFGILTVSIFKVHANKLKLSSQQPHYVRDC